MLYLAPLGLHLALLAGCAPEKHAIRKDDDERTLLADSAQIHWDGMRWSDPERAALFIELEDDRALYRSRLVDHFEKSRLTDVSLLKVTVTEALADDQLAGRWREGEVFVRTEGYKIPAQIVESEEVRQRWYRTPTGWWMAWTPDEDVIP